MDQTANLESRIGSLEKKKNETFLLSDLFSSNGAKNTNHEIVLIEKMARESKAKENKANNLVISGIMESSNKNKEKIDEDDKLSVITLLKEIG
ncbi:hypothetical protein BpHYR1_003862, partial [Brachionus plicatilis]